MFAIRSRYVLLFACIPALMAATHRPLLPRPQKVTYGRASVPVNALRIRIAGTVTPEDRFAAEVLSLALNRRTGIQVSIAAARDARPEIVFERTGPVDPLPVPNEEAGPDSREAYSLDATASGVVIRARSSAGLFYAVQTLSQLVEGNDDKAVIPEVRVEDWPSLPLRGAMVDMSEGQLATEAEVRRQIDQLALWKANQYYLYNEDSIELDGYPLLNAGARFTKDQIRHIVAYGRERHIDVVPCLELYGHQHDLFRNEKYSELADLPHGGEFDPSNPKIRPVLNDWIAQYSGLFSSRFVHIGFDETWEIAHAARKQGAGMTPARLFVTQLGLVARGFQEHGKTVMAWADIMVKYPDIIPELPPGLIPVPWFYEPDPDPKYREWLDPLAKRHIPSIVAPGVNMWTEIVPDFRKSFRNIDTFLAAGKEAGAFGLINTFWTDNQEVLRRMAWPGFAYGAAAAWQTAPVDANAFFSDYASIVYPSAAAPHVATVLERLSAAEIALQTVWDTHTMDSVWQSPFAPGELKRLQEHYEDLRSARLLAESAQENLAAALHAGADRTALNSLAFGARHLDYAGMRGMYAVEIAELWKKQRAQRGGDTELWDLLSGSFSRTHGRLGDLLDSLSELKPLYRENWLAEYTAYRMETALARWDAEYQYWLRVERRYARFQAEYAAGSALPTIDAVTGEY